MGRDWLQTNHWQPLIEWVITENPFLASIKHLLELEFYKLLSKLSMTFFRISKFLNSNLSISFPSTVIYLSRRADGCSPYLMLFPTKLDQITHLSCKDMMMEHDSIIPLYMFPSLAHLAMDQCSYIGPSLAAYKSPTPRDLRIRCSVLDSSKAEELKNITRLISSFSCLGLLALDPPWSTSTMRYRSVGWVQSWESPKIRQTCWEALYLERASRPVKRLKRTKRSLRSQRNSEP